MKDRILHLDGLKQSSNPSIPWMPLGLIAASFAFYGWLVWQRVPGMLGDQGWFLQVSRRVAFGEVLYRDVLWSYGPLPVYLMSWLMQIGDNDIHLFSLLHIMTATITTLALYGLHRSQLEPFAAVTGVFLVLIIGGAATPFLVSYTPGIPLGAMGMLLTLCGVLGCLKSKRRFLSGLVLVLGLDIALLSKLEFGFGALVFCIFASLIVYRTRLASPPDRSYSTRVLVASGIGILLAAIFYGTIALQSGWQPLLDGITGYQVLQVAAGVSMGFWGTGSMPWLLAVYIPASATVLLIGAYLFYRDRLTEIPKCFIWSIFSISIVAYLIYVLLWQTGVIRDVQQTGLNSLDLANICNRLKTAWATLTWFAPLQFNKTLLIGICIIALFLIPQWIKRWKKRESVSFEQLACLMTIVYAVLIEMRYLIFSSSFMIPTAFVFLATILPAEFPQLKTRTPKVNRMLAIAVTLATLLALHTWYGLWRHLTNFDTSYVSSRGTYLADLETQAIAASTVQYIQAHTNPSDCIAVLGPHPGIYYLSERWNCFRQDYISPVIGSSPSDAIDYLTRMDRFGPPLLLVPQGDHNAGILQRRGTPDDGMFVRATHRRLFGDAAPQVETYLLEHYEFDRFLNANGAIVFAAFKRIK